MTWQTCSSVTCRLAFFSNGRLTNTSDTSYREINRNWPVMAYALDLGNITQTSRSMVFALGLVRDPVVRYMKDGMFQSRSSLWWTRWSSIGDVVSVVTYFLFRFLTKADLNKKIDEFLSGYTSALSRAVNFENRIMSDIASISSNFTIPPSTTINITDMITLSLRQTIGSLEFTTSRLSNGRFAGVDDLRVFMKDVGSSSYVTYISDSKSLLNDFLNLPLKPQTCQFRGNNLRFFPGLPLPQRFTRGYIA